MNPILLVHQTTGPTFRKRLVNNILDNLDSYLLFDNLILTDVKDDYSPLLSYPNIRIEYFDDLKKEYSWSTKYEPFPIKTKNEEEYAKFILDNSHPIPSSFFRFIFLSKDFENYNNVFFLNCDVINNFTPQLYNDFLELINNFKNDTAIGHNSYTRNQYKPELQFISEKYNISIKKENLESNDGNLFGYIFKDYNKKKQLGELFNNIVYSILVEDPIKLYNLGRHGNWSIKSEEIQSIVHSLLDIEVFPKENIMAKGFEICTYPEDRFWNWSSEGFKCNNISKKLFIEENYDILKTFYINRNQIWQYE